MLRSENKFATWAGLRVFARCSGCALVLTASILLAQTPPHASQEPTGRAIEATDVAVRPIEATQAYDEGSRAQNTRGVAKWAPANSAKPSVGPQVKNAATMPRSGSLTAEANKSVPESQWRTHVIGKASGQGGEIIAVQRVSGDAEQTSRRIARGYVNRPAQKRGRATRRTLVRQPNGTWVLNPELQTTPEQAKLAKSEARLKAAGGAKRSKKSSVAGKQIQ